MDDMLKKPFFVENVGKEHGIMKYFLIVATRKRYFLRYWGHRLESFPTGQRATFYLEFPDGCYGFDRKSFKRITDKKLLKHLKNELTLLKQEALLKEL
jgi:hypothetical protein